MRIHSMNMRVLKTNTVSFKNESLNCLDTFTMVPDVLRQKDLTTVPLRAYKTNSSQERVTHTKYVMQ